MTEVIVIGGGIIGASLTYRLAAGGARVSLIEARHLAAGTSGSSFAWTNANNKTPTEYFRLNVFGMAEYRRLRREFGETPWFHQSGNIEWADNEEGWAELQSRVLRLRAWGYAAEWISRAEIASLEPDVAPPPGLEKAVHFPSEGYIDVPLLIGRLIREAIAAGATVRTGCRVQTLEMTSGRVTGVRTSQGERIAGDIVVSCAGPWSDDVARMAGVDCPLAPTIGLTAISSHSPVALRGIVHTPLLALRPDGAGRVMMRGEHFDGLVEATTRTMPIPKVCNEILRESIRVLPGLEGTRVEAARIGIRPLPIDGQSVVGPVPGVEGLHLVCTHSGVTMGPFIGRALATEIITSRQDKRLAPFRPGRIVVAVQPRDQFTAAGPG